MALPELTKQAQLFNMYLQAAIQGIRLRESQGNARSDVAKALFEKQPGEWMRYVVLGLNGESLEEGTFRPDAARLVGEFVKAASEAGIEQRLVGSLNGVLVNKVRGSSLPIERAIEPLWMSNDCDKATLEDILRKKKITDLTTAVPTLYTELRIVAQDSLGSFRRAVIEELHARGVQKRKDLLYLLDAFLTLEGEMDAWHIPDQHSNLARTIIETASYKAVKEGYALMQPFSRRRFIPSSKFDATMALVDNFALDTLVANGLPVPLAKALPVIEQQMSAGGKLNPQYVQAYRSEVQKHIAAKGYQALLQPTELHELRETSLKIMSELGQQQKQQIFEQRREREEDLMWEEREADKAPGAKAGYAKPNAQKGQHIARTPERRLYNGGSRQSQRPVRKQPDRNADYGPLFAKAMEQLRDIERLRAIEAERRDAGYTGQARPSQQTSAWSNGSGGPSLGRQDAAVTIPAPAPKQPFYQSYVNNVIDSLKQVPVSGEPAGKDKDRILRGVDSSITQLTEIVRRHKGDAGLRAQVDKVIELGRTTASQANGFYRRGMEPVITDLERCYESGLSKVLRGLHLKR